MQLRSAMRGFTVVLIGAVLLVLFRNKKRKEEEARRRWMAAKKTGDLSIIFEWAGDTLGSLCREPLLQGKMQFNETARCRANLFAAVVNNAVGVFKQVNVVGEPIYKHVSGGAWGMRQINTVGQAIYKHIRRLGTTSELVGKASSFPALAVDGITVLDAVAEPLYRPSRFGTTSQFVGKASSFFALAIDGVTVLDAVVEDYRRGSMHSTVRSVSKATGGYYGAKYGAAAGANALSFVPLVGPLAGGFIGGSLGMASGSSIGGYVAEVITDTAGR